jgi:hypothetical protein
MTSRELLRRSHVSIRSREPNMKNLLSLGVYRMRTMQKRKLEKVSKPQFLGCMEMNWFYHPLPDRKGMISATLGA